MEICLSNVEKKYGELQALYPINLKIATGEFISLLGPSGCGKTTLLRMIAGLETPDDGEIKFAETVIYSKKNRIEVSPQKRKIGMVFQDFALWPHMTVFENVAYSLKATGQRRDLKKVVEEALENVQLREYSERYPHQLSGGQQQRVAFARAIANQPSIILLDEPLSALDASLRDDMRVLLQTLVKKLGMTAIYVTHDQSEAMAMSDRIVVIHQGKLVQVDTPENVYNKPKNEIVASFVGRGVLLTGTLRFASSKPVLVVNEHVSISFTHHSSPLENEKITIVVRPEEIELVPLQASDAIRAVVETCSFFGERYELVLRIKKSKQTLLAYSKCKYQLGEEVYARLQTETIHILQTCGGNKKYETA